MTLIRTSPTLQRQGMGWMNLTIAQMSELLASFIAVPMCLLYFSSSFQRLSGQYTSTATFPEGESYGAQLSCQFNGASFCG